MITALPSGDLGLYILFVVIASSQCLVILALLHEENVIIIIIITYNISTGLAKEQCYAVKKIAWPGKNKMGKILTALKEIVIEKNNNE